MDLINHASVTLLDQLKPIVINFFSWRHPDFEAQIKEAGEKSPIAKDLL